MLLYRGCFWCRRALVGLCEDCTSHFDVDWCLRVCSRRKGCFWCSRALVGLCEDCTSHFDVDWCLRVCSRGEEKWMWFWFGFWSWATHELVCLSLEDKDVGRKGKEGKRANGFLALCVDGTRSFAYTYFLLPRVCTCAGVKILR